MKSRYIVYYFFTVALDNTLAADDAETHVPQQRWHEKRDFSQYYLMVAMKESALS